MLLCGAEEPLLPNPQIHALDESTGQVVLGDFGVANANRYSFVWLGAHSGASAALSAMLAATARALSLPVAGCAVWAASDDPARAPSQRKVRWQHEKDGWHVVASDGLVTAVKAIAEDDLVFPLRDLGARSVLFLGEGARSETIREPAILPSLGLLARFRMAPSEPLLRWLSDRGWALAYPARDDLGRSGCIVAGGPRLPLRELEAAGLVQETRWNADAAGVWRVPPSR
jgi:hypothetical protein